MLRPAQALFALVLWFLAACQGTRMVADPVLEVRGAEGATELAVSTDYGLVFLGRTARSGPIEVTAWFGDGPSIEFTVVEPLGGGLFTAEPQIRLPRVPMSFETPRAGQTLRLIGRRGRSKWSADVTVRSDKAVAGLIVDVPGELADKPGQAGAGLYLAGPGEHDLRLVGLVTGEVEVTAADGGSRRYLTAVGPDQLWRLVTYRRNFPRQRKFVYRADVM
jgi:hypothetical protein